MGTMAPVRRHSTLLLRALAGLTLTTLIACSSDSPVFDEPTDPVTPSPTASDEPAANFVECVNDAESYTVSYPDDWYTASTAPENECRWFDRDPLTLDEGSEPPPLDLEVIAETRSFDEVVDRIGGPDSGEELLSSEPTTIGGYNAVEFETRSTGEGPLAVNSMTYGFVLDVDGRTFLVITQLIQPEAPPYEENQVVVAEVAAAITVIP